MRRLLGHVAYRRRRLQVWSRSVVVRHPGPETAVWICSWQRSGSTWLAEQLASAPRTRLIYEPANVPDGLVTGEEAARRAIPSASPEHVSAVAQALAGRTSGHWVDQLNASHWPVRTVVKDVRGMDILDQVRAVNVETPFVVLVRHPFSVAASAVRLGWFDPALTAHEAFVREVQHWCAVHMRQLELWQQHSAGWQHTLWVAYEELTGDVVGETVDSVIDFLADHNATWSITKNHLNVSARSATDFAGAAVSVDETWRVDAGRFLASSVWGALYDVTGRQRMPMSQFLASQSH